MDRRALQDLRCSSFLLKIESGASGIRSIRCIEEVQYGVLEFSWSGDHDKYLPESFMNLQAQIRRIFLDGYGVLVVRSADS
ncbi:hypothetical protein Tco_0398068 [Tanacetum coccineum]